MKKMKQMYVSVVVAHAPIIPRGIEYDAFLRSPLLLLPACGGAW
jgi:hypothetical protein